MNALSIAAVSTVQRNVSSQLFINTCFMQPLESTRQLCTSSGSAENILGPESQKISKNILNSANSENVVSHIS